MAQAWDPNPHVYASGNGPTWSLSCEFFFYAMFPLPARGVRRLGPRGLAISAAVVLAVMAVVPALVGPHGLRPRRTCGSSTTCPATGSASSSSGCWRPARCNSGCASPARRPADLLGWAWVAAWVVFTTLYTRTHHGDPVARPFATMLVLPGFVLLVLVGASADLTGRTRLMGAWLPVQPGEWSFALYLVQVAIIAPVTTHLTLSKTEMAYGGWLMLAFLVLCTAVAVVAHYAIEKPAESWLRARGPGRRTAGDGGRPPEPGPRPPEPAALRPPESGWTGPRHRRTGARPEPTYPAALQP